ncbi:MAG TPA: hypothetical protein VN667_07245 [Burkholderiales bacterium]|nr:hypothetical protein [Burkholderiales bacterium]
MTPIKTAVYAACGLSLFCLAALVQNAAQAQERRHREYEVRHGFWAGDIHRFHEHDLELWRRGRWIHDRHNGRFGWWWVVGGVWYFYPAPVYPYPDPFQPPTVVLGPEPSPPHYWYYCGNPQGYYPYVAQCAVPWQRQLAGGAPVPAPSPPPPVITAPPAPQQFWYYCDNPAGYYPTVPQCPTPWRRVPANEPPAGR